MCLGFTGSAPGALNLQVVIWMGADPRTAVLLVWAPSPGTVPVVTGGLHWWAKPVIPGFWEVPFGGLMYVGGRPNDCNCCLIGHRPQ